MKGTDKTRGLSANMISGDYNRRKKFENGIKVLQNKEDTILRRKIQVEIQEKINEGKSKKNRK